MNGEQQIYQELTPIFHEAFGNDSIELRPEMTAKDVEGWDSMKMVMIIVAVEQHFGLRLKTREIDALTSVGDFVRLIQSKRQVQDRV
jgi:acyl carrier protein